MVKRFFRKRWKKKNSAGVGRQISVLWVLSVWRNRLHYTCIKDMEMPVVLYLTIPCVV
jgi:hypothetical protein